VKIKVSPETYAKETIHMAEYCGLLLVSGRVGRANVMTIGWGLIGPLWGKPFFIVAVRPSRYTYKFIEGVGDFTVNVPRVGMERVVTYCGTVSGRDHDKFGEMNLTIEPSKYVNSPIISECVVHYECKVVYKTRVVPNLLPEEILSTCYPADDYHTLYFGEILATYADKDAKEKLLSEY